MLVSHARFFNWIRCIMRNMFSKEQMVFLLLYKVGTANTKPAILKKKTKLKCKWNINFNKEVGSWQNCKFIVVLFMCIEQENNILNIFQLKDELFKERDESKLYFYQNYSYSQWKRFIDIYIFILQTSLTKKPSL